MTKLWKALTGVALGAATAYLLPKNKPERIPVGESSFLLPDDGGVTGDPIPVYCYRPATWREEDPVFIAFPGIGRGADRYRDHLEEAAVKYNMLVACPDFTKAKFPHMQWYQNANMFEGKNWAPVLHPRSAWTFPSIDHVVRAVKKRTHGKKVVLFGFSAGGQLIQRFSLLSETNHADLTIIASPGWYTMPDRYFPFPYGLKGLTFSDRELAHGLSRPMLLLIGANDVTQKQPFPDDPHTNMQGYNRMERINNYFHTAQSEALRLGIKLPWKMGIVPDAAHDEIKMTVGAMKKLCGEPLDEIIEM